MNPPRIAVLLSLSLGLGGSVASGQGTPSAFTGDELVAFRTPAGTFFSAGTGSGPLRADAARLGRSEQFRLIPLGAGKYAIQVYGTGRHLTAKGGGITSATAGIGRTEQFVLVCARSGTCALRTAGGEYLSTQGGLVRTSAGQPNATSVFRVMTPRPAASGPAARAKTGVILGQIAGPIVQGAVGYDRFGAWEDAVANHPAPLNAATSAYAPWVVAQSGPAHEPLVSIPVGPDDADEPDEPNDRAPAPRPVGNEPKAPALPQSMSEEETADYSWKSTWTRRGNSNVYDARYTGPQGQGGATVNTVWIDRDRGSFSAQRTSSADNNLCSYSGTIQADGKTVQGTFTCSMGGSRPWRGVLNW